MAFECKTNAGTLTIGQVQPDQLNHADGVRMQDERRDTDDRTSPARSVKPRSLPKSNGRRSRDREGYQEKKKTHVERVTPANYARRKFAPPCWTTVRGAQDAPNSNAAPDGSIRKTPCRARAYHAATGRTTINRGEGELEKITAISRTDNKGAGD
jgi:hypothetical protein